MIPDESVSKLVTDIFPSLSQEMQRLLIELGETDLAAQVPQLCIVERCRCGDDFCATFYVQPKPTDGYGPGHRNVALTPKTGMLILDVVNEKITCVEVLYRDEIREKLLASFP
jgi:hypothetical protein